MLEDLNWDNIIPSDTLNPRERLMNDLMNDPEWTIACEYVLQANSRSRNKIQKLIKGYLKTLNTESISHLIQFANCESDNPNIISSVSDFEKSVGSKVLKEDMLLLYPNLIDNLDRRLTDIITEITGQPFNTRGFPVISNAKNDEEKISLYIMLAKWVKEALSR